MIDTSSPSCGFLPEVFEKCFTSDGRTLLLRKEEDRRGGASSQLIRIPVTNEYLSTADACKGGQQKTWNVRQSMFLFMGSFGISCKIARVLRSRRSQACKAAQQRCIDNVWKKEGGGEYMASGLDDNQDDM